MRKRDLENRLTVLYHTLELMNLFETHFKEVLGSKGYYQKIDEVLDETNSLREELDNLNRKNNEDEGRN